MTTTTIEDDEYETWMEQVDLAVFAEAGISVHDLGDFNSRDLFDSEVSPEEAAIQALDDDDLYQHRGF